MTSSSTWVDFKAVKAAVSISQVLAHYDVNWLKKQGDERRGKCPFESCRSEDGFHANTGKGAFQCFKCKRRGNVLDFVAAMEGCTVRDAAVKLAEWFSVEASTASSENGSKQSAPGVEKTESNGSGEVELVNKPLTFELKGVDASHAYLKTRGVSPELAAKFGCGFFPGKGSMSGRVVFPIHNGKGELVAYAGRAVDGTEPKYKLPVGFHKSLELFNLHRTADESNKRRVVVVVEGFFDCLAVTAAGFPCVSLMGSSLSQRQQELLGTHFKACWLMLDGDDAGRQGTAEMLPRLARSLWVRQAVVPDGKQPDAMTEEELRVVIGK